MGQTYLNLDLDWCLLAGDASQLLNDSKSTRSYIYKRVWGIAGRGTVAWLVLETNINKKPTLERKGDLQQTDEMKQCRVLDSHLVAEHFYLSLGN